MFEQSALEKIQVITHSGVRIDCGKIVYIDPISVGSAPHDADLILFTHPHFDHFSPPNAKKLMNEHTVIAAPKSMAGLCSLMLGRKAAALQPAQTYDLGGVTVETVAAYNNAKPFHLKAMKWLGYIVNIGQTRVYISGDTDITDESRSVSCDIAMLPIGGFYTVGPEQAAALVNEIAPHTVIPLHYGKLLGGGKAPERFRAALKQSIEADIRQEAFSNVLVRMYLAGAAALALLVILEFLLLK